MENQNCLFCKIIKKEVPADIVFEDENFIAFKDINPKAEIHLLIVPKKHISSVKEASEEDKDILGGLILTAKKIAEKENIQGYKLIINVGREGGQVIDHIHLHLLAGRFSGTQLSHLP